MRKMEELEKKRREEEARKLEEEKIRLEEERLVSILLLLDQQKFQFDLEFL